MKKKNGSLYLHGLILPILVRKIIKKKSVITLTDMQDSGAKFG